MSLIASGPGPLQRLLTRIPPPSYRGNNAGKENCRNLCGKSVTGYLLVQGEQGCLVTRFSACQSLKKRGSLLITDRSSYSSIEAARSSSSDHARAISSSGRAGGGEIGHASLGLTACDKSLPCLYAARHAEHVLETGVLKHSAGGPAAITCPSVQDRRLCRSISLSRDFSSARGMSFGPGWWPCSYSPGWRTSIRLYSRAFLFHQVLRSLGADFRYFLK